jgi:hypothetical protein
VLAQVGGHDLVHEIALADHRCVVSGLADVLTGEDSAVPSDGEIDLPGREHTLPGDDVLISEQGGHSGRPCRSVQPTPARAAISRTLISRSGLSIQWPPSSRISRGIASIWAAASCGLRSGAAC